MKEDDRNRRLRGGTLAPVLLGIALLGGPALIPGPAESQPGSGVAAADTAAADTTAADTTAATGPRRPGDGGIVETPELLGSFSPKYFTSYNVNRKSTEWTQTFTFGSGVGFLDFKNETDFKVKTDSGQDENLRDGNNKTTIQWRMIKKLPITTSLNVGQVSLTRPNDERQTDNLRSDLSAIYNVFTGPIRHTFNAGAGYNYRTDLSIRNDSRSESKDKGFAGNLSWKGNWRLDRMTLNASVRENRTSKTSELVKDDGSRETRPTDNRSRAVNLTLSYDPAAWLSSNVTVNNNSGNDEYFLVQGGQGSLEKKESLNRGATATFNFKPGGKTFFDWRMSATENELSYQVRKEIASSSNGTSWEGKLRSEILGARVEGTLSSRQDVLEPATSADTETQNNVFDGKIDRQLSSKISARFNWLVRATQVFFTDPDPTRELDRDELRTKLQPGITYTPGKKWKVTASYVRSTYRRVEQNPQRATQTKDDEDFSVDFNISYDMSERTSINQSYSIKALYSTFDYNSKSDRLTSTQQIVTTLTSALTPRVDMTFEHRFTLQDSGPFRFDASGNRIFARSFRRYDQEMSTDLRYALAPWLTLTFNSRFFRTDNLNEASNIRTTFRNLDLRQGFAVNQNLGKGTTFGVTGTYNRSNVQESYWVITSTLNKDF